MSYVFYFIFFFLHQSVISVAVDDIEYYMLIKEHTVIVTQVTMTLNFKIRQTDKNRRA